MMNSIATVDSIVLLINHFALTKDIKKLVKSVREVEVIFTKYYINSDSKQLVIQAVDLYGDPLSMWYKRV